MFKKVLRGIVERPWLRIGLAVALLIVGLAPVGAPILSDNNLRQALSASGAASAAPAFVFRYDNAADGTAQVQRSQAGSQHWVNVSVIPAAVQQLTAAPSSTGQLVFARSENDIWRSEDAGATWSKVQALPSKPLSMAVAPEQDKVLLAGTAANGLFLSSDEGLTWRPAGGALTVTGVGTMAVSAVALNPTDSQVIYATTQFTMATPEGVHTAENAFVSVDGARHWFQMQPSGAPNSAATGKAATQLVPVANRPLAVSASGQAGAHTYELQATPELLASLQSTDPGVRAAAARALGLAGDRAAVPALVKQVFDPDQAAGDRAAEALGRLGDTTAVPALTTALTADREEVRGRAALALGMLKDEAAVGQLANMLQHDGPLARGQAADGLAALGTPAAIAALMAPLADAQMTSGRQLAMQGLEEIGLPALSQLTAALSVNDPVVRRNAAEALGWIRAADAVPALAKTLNDSDPQVRTEASWALGEIGTTPAQQALAHEIVVEKDQATRQAASQALAQSQKTHAVGEAVPSAPLAAFLAALTQVPASRWTLLFLGVLLAAVLLALNPRQARQRA